MGETRKYIIRAIAFVALACIIATQCQPQPRFVERRGAPTPTVETQSVKTNFVYYFPQASVVRSLKKGAAITMLVDPLEACGDVRALGATWFYAWGRGLPACPEIDSVSQIWGELDTCQPINGSSPWLFEYNEPDQVVQANLTPERAAALMREIERCYPDRLLVSPAQSQADLTWLQRARGAYNDAYRDTEQPFPRWDAIAIHCYAATREMVTGCREYVRIAGQWSLAWGARGVFVTEFAIIPGGALTEDDAIELESEWIAEMERDPRVLGYAHFVNRWDDRIVEYCDSCERFALFRFGGLTRFGEMYRSK